jgi:MSHA biogenesis protein MshJ
MMQVKFLQLVLRIEGLSMRERAMLLLGAPLLLVIAGELMVFGPARKQATEAHKQTELQQGELKALGAVLAAQPAVVALPAEDQLLQQRDELQGRIDAARAIMGSVERSVDWGTVVRSTVAGTPGLTLTQLKTMPPELVFAPSMVKPPVASAGRPGAPASSIGVKAAAPAGVSGTVFPVLAGSGPGVSAEGIYRHRAELTVTGNFGTLLGYLMDLQRLPGDLRWDKLQLSVAAFPQASVQLTLHTLSNRAETPFN